MVACGPARMPNLIIVSIALVSKMISMIQPFPANAISWGALGPEMFGAHGVYHMVPISLAIGLFCPLPFYIAVSPLLPQ